MNNKKLKLDKPTSELLIARNLKKIEKFINNEVLTVIVEEALNPKDFNADFNADFGGTKSGIDATGLKDFSTDSMMGDLLIANYTISFNEETGEMEVERVDGWVATNIVM